MYPASFSTPNNPGVKQPSEFLRLCLPLLAFTFDQAADAYHRIRYPDWTSFSRIELSRTRQTARSKLAAGWRHCPEVVAVGTPDVPATACSNRPDGMLNPTHSMTDAYKTIFRTWTQRPGLLTVEAYCHRSNLQLVRQGIKRVRSEYLSAELLLTHRHFSLANWANCNWVSRSYSLPGDNDGERHVAMADFDDERGRPVTAVVPVGLFWQAGSNEEDVATMVGELERIEAECRARGRDFELWGPTPRKRLPT